MKKLIAILIAATFAASACLAITPDKDKPKHHMAHPMVVHKTVVTHGHKHHRRHHHSRHKGKTVVVVKHHPVVKSHAVVKAHKPVNH